MDVDTKAHALLKNIKNAPKELKKELLTNFFSNYNINDNELLFINFEIDIKKVINQFNIIFSSLKKEDIVNKNFIILKFFDINKYLLINNNKYINDFIINLKSKFKTADYNNLFEYIEKNVSYLQSHYDMVYVYKFKKFIETSHVLNSINFIKQILYKIINKYQYIIHHEMYKFVLNSLFNTNSNKDNSKIIGNIQYKYEIETKNLYNYIKKNQTLYFSNNEPFMSNITLEYLDVKKELNCKIFMHEFNTKLINESILTKTTGLCNFELYRLLNNSNMPICYNNKSLFSINNDIRIDTRHFYSKKDFIELDINSDTFDIVKRIINIPNLNAGYTPFMHNDSIIYLKNSIINMYFTKKEYENLDNAIINCNNRYLIVYCSEGNFKNNIIDIKIHYTGAHRASLIIDKLNKQIIYFDPLGYRNYITYFTEQTHHYINVILALELSKNIKSLDNYTFLCYNNDILPQSKEITPLLNKLYDYNLKQIFNPEKQKLRDWAGGYCGLWNYLYIFLLVINPQLDLQDIYSFFYKITNLDYSPMFVKLLIRNFAYYIENALVTPNYVIPLTQLDIKQFDNIALTEVIFNANNNSLKLRSLRNSNYYQKIESTTQNKNFEFDEFMANLKFTRSLKKDLPKVK